MISIFALHFSIATYVILCFTFHNTLSVKINKFSNGIFVTRDIISTFTNLTCDQCMCMASIAYATAWNCIMNTNTCQLISTYPSANGHFQLTINGSFFYRNYSSGVTVSVSTTMTTTTTTTMTTTTTTTVLTTSKKSISIK